MRRTRTERGALLLSGCLCAAGTGCGDIGDAQVPLPIYGASSEPPADVVFVENADAVAGRAVVRVALSPAAESVCPQPFEALVPDASAATTLVDGAGPRAVAGRNAIISCGVVERPRGAGVFDIDFSVLHAELPLLRAAGQVRTGASSTLALDITLPDRTSVDATCPSEIIEVLDGAVWFRTVACRTPGTSRGTGACVLDLEAIFENCRQ